MAKKNTPLSVAQRNLLPPVILRSPDVLSAVMDAATNLDVVEFQSNPWGQAWALIRSGDVQDLKLRKKNNPKKPEKLDEIRKCACYVKKTKKKRSIMKNYDIKKRSHGVQMIL